jgi:hypothetical protein
MLSLAFRTNVQLRRPRKLEIVSLGPNLAVVRVVVQLTTYKIRLLVQRILRLCLMLATMRIKRKELD